MTVKQLLIACQQQVLNGNGDKKIFISQDDEWNSYHELLSWFIYEEDDIQEQEIENHEYDLEDIILLW